MLRIRKPFANFAKTRMFARRSFGAYRFRPNRMKRRFNTALACFAIFFLAFAEEATAARTPPPEGRFERETSFEWSPLVEQIQRLLLEFDLFAGPVNGILTPETRQSIRDYQKQGDLPVDGEADEDLLKHMETVGRAETLKLRLARARDEQIEHARNALTANPETRDLLEAEKASPAAMPKAAVDACLRDPSVDCLLAGAVSEIAAIERDDYRDWALRDLVRAQARAGRTAEARASVKRLSDLRLVMVSLRETAAALAEAGRIADAVTLAETIPDDWHKARAWLAIARTEAGLASGTDALLTILPAIADKDAAVEIAADLAGVLAERPDRQRADRAISALDLLTTGDARLSSGAWGAAASGYAQTGDADKARRALKRMGDTAREHIALARVAGMLAEQAKPNEALTAAERLRSPQLFVLAMTQIAAAQNRLGNAEAARESLIRAEAALPDIERPYAADTARARIAAVWLALSDRARAIDSTGRIDSPSLKAQTLWRFARNTVPPASDESDAVILAVAATERIESAFDRAATLVRAADGFTRSGQKALARETFNRAARETLAIHDSWWRARMLSLLASALVEL